MNGKHHRIVGTVVGRHDKLGIPQLRVEAWDADVLTRDDWLGEAVTAADGSFEIAFAQAQYAELFEGEPEIYFRVYAGQHLAEDLVCDVNAVPDSDDYRARISIQLPAPSAGDVTRQRSAFASHLEALARRCHPDNPRKFLSSLGQIFTTAGNTPFTTSRAPSFRYPTAHDGAHSHSATQARLCRVARIEARDVCEMLSQWLIRPLDGDEELQSASLVARTAIQELLGELCRPDAPQTERIDHLLAVLRDQTVRLQELVGSDAEFTAAHAHAASDLLIVSNYVDQLWKLWSAPDGLRSELVAAAS